MMQPLQEAAGQSRVAAAEGTLPIVDEAESLRRAMTALLPDLRRYARFLLRDAAEADDLVQEALTRALAALPGYRNDGNMRGWLFTIQRNVFYEQARRRRTERVVLADAGLGGEHSAPAQHGHVDLADLTRHLFELSPLLREALVLVGAHGLSYDDAAAVCAVPVGTMKARVSRARARLGLAMMQPLAADT